MVSCRRALFIVLLSALHLSQGNDESTHRPGTESDDNNVVLKGIVKSHRGDIPVHKDDAVTSYTDTGDMLKGIILRHSSPQHETGSSSQPAQNLKEVKVSLPHVHTPDCGCINVPGVIPLNKSQSASFSSSHSSSFSSSRSSSNSGSYSSSQTGSHSSNQSGSFSSSQSESYSNSSSSSSSNNYSSAQSGSHSGSFSSIVNGSASSNQNGKQGFTSSENEYIGQLDQSTIAIDTLNREDVVISDVHSSGGSSLSEKSETNKEENKLIHGENKITYPITITSENYFQSHSTPETLIHSLNGEGDYYQKNEELSGQNVTQSSNQDVSVLAHGEESINQNSDQKLIETEDQTLKGNKNRSLNEDQTQLNLQSESLTDNLHIQQSEYYSNKNNNDQSSSQSEAHSNQNSNQAITKEDRSSIDHKSRSNDQNLHLSWGESGISGKEDTASRNEQIIDHEIYNEQQSQSKDDSINSHSIDQSIQGSHSHSSQQGNDQSIEQITQSNVYDLIKQNHATERIVSSAGSDSATILGVELITESSNYGKRTPSQHIEQKSEGDEEIQSHSIEQITQSNNGGSSSNQVHVFDQTSELTESTLIQNDQSVYDQRSNQKDDQLIWDDENQSSIEQVTDSEIQTQIQVNANTGIFNDGLVSNNHAHSFTQTGNGHSNGVEIGLSDQKEHTLSTNTEKISNNHGSSSVTQQGIASKSEITTSFPIEHVRANLNEEKSYSSSQSVNNNGNTYPSHNLGTIASSHLFPQGGNHVQSSTEYYVQNIKQEIQSPSQNFGHSSGENESLRNHNISLEQRESHDNTLSSSQSENTLLKVTSTTPSSSIHNNERGSFDSGNIHSKDQTLVQSFDQNEDKIFSTPSSINLQSEVYYSQRTTSDLPREKVIPQSFHQKDDNLYIQQVTDSQRSEHGVSLSDTQNSDNKDKLLNQGVHSYISPGGMYVQSPQFSEKTGTESTGQSQSHSSGKGENKYFYQSVNPFISGVQPKRNNAYGQQSGGSYSAGQDISQYSGQDRNQFGTQGIISNPSVSGTYYYQSGTVSPQPGVNQFSNQDNQGIRYYQALNYYPNQGQIHYIRRGGYNPYQNKILYTTNGNGSLNNSGSQSSSDVSNDNVQHRQLVNPFYYINCNRCHYPSQNSASSQSSSSAGSGSSFSQSSSWSSAGSSSQTSSSSNSFGSHYPGFPTQGNSSPNVTGNGWNFYPGYSGGSSHSFSSSSSSSSSSGSSSSFSSSFGGGHPGTWKPPSTSTTSTTTEFVIPEGSCDGGKAC